ncbi:hypothetical protein [Brucella pituitosa]|uniref:hypothetical protein n=1 Tax=Brucella pituitosa TaxID=571256 RepID=UPI003F4AA567
MAETRDCAVPARSTSAARRATRRPPLRAARRTRPQRGADRGDEQYEGVRPLARRAGGEPDVAVAVGVTPFLRV